jgi:hypothetical protein
LKEAVREHGLENLLQRARAYWAAQRAAGEGSETTKTKQQERKTETELSRTDQAAAERGCRARQEGEVHREACKEED